MCLYFYADVSGPAPRPPPQHQVRTMPPLAASSQPRASSRRVVFAERLILQVCWEWPDRAYLKRIRANLTKQGIRAAVARHDTPALFDWLMEIANYQGISDTIAWSYLEKHGRVRCADIDAALQRNPDCPKLGSFDQFTGCNYRKANRTCAHPQQVDACSVPSHPMRKGGLNQTAYALFLFLRDECRGDLVAWIDDQLAAADVPEAPDRVQR